MNFRTMLLASAAVMVATSAVAADFTNPFYLPAQGKILSDTRIATERAKWDEDADGSFKEKQLGVAETLTVGVVDNLAVVGTVANVFDHDYDHELNNDHNFEYTLGAKYNMNFGKVVAQAGVYFDTFDVESWTGENDGYVDSRWRKILTGEFKVGYNCDCGTTLYTALTVSGAVDQEDRDQEYSWFVGAHKMIGDVAVDAGVVYAWATENHENQEEWHVQASADYYVKDNFTVGAYGDYYIGGRERKDIQYDYTFGLSAKVLF